LGSRFLITEHFEEVIVTHFAFWRIIMATAPRITVYELFKDRPSKEVGTILSPDQLYAIATAMSYVESDFMLRNKSPEDKRCIQIYDNCCNTTPEKLLTAFAWYCQTCSEIAILLDGPGQEDKSSWKAKPDHFARTVRVFLSRILFTNNPIDKDRGDAFLKILGSFNDLIEREVESKALDQGKAAEKKESVIRRILLYPLRKIVRPFIPVYYINFNRQTGLLAHESLERIINLCRQATEERRVFTFSVPEDQREGGVSIGGMQMQNLKGGKIITSQFLK
jgi:hypothetical protein